MKRRLICLLLAVLLTAACTASAEEEAMISLKDFESLFNHASESLETDHRIIPSRTALKPGDNGNLFVITFSDAFVLQLTIPKDTTDVSRAWILYVPTAEGAEQGEPREFLSLVAELLYATDAADTLADAASVIEELDLVARLEAGAVGTLTRRNRRIGIAPLQNVGWIFSVEPPIPETPEG